MEEILSLQHDCVISNAAASIVISWAVISWAYLVLGSFTVAPGVTMAGSMLSMSVEHLRQL